MDKELKEKLIKAKNKEEVTDMLKAAGQDVSVADKIWNEIKKSREKEEKTLSMDELDAVSGGIFFLGDDAPDGHELSCLVTYYAGWDEFYRENKDEYCWGQKGQKHEFDDGRCKLCGYKKK